MSLSERRAAAAAAATAFALAARSAMAHLGHAGASVGVASGRAVTMAAGAAERRCEWTVTGDVVARAERLAASADAEVLCDLLVVKQCASSGIIDFDPLPHVSGDDVVCARNLSAGHLDRIVGIAGGSRRHANGGGGNFFVSDGGGDFASSSMLGRLELTERGAVAGDGVAPGPCILMPQGTRENFGDASAKRRALREKEKSESEARESEDADGHVASETQQKSSAEDDAARRATEAEAISTAAGRLSYGALAALSLASASVATAETLRLLWDRHGKLPAPPPLVAHETTLLAAKRVIAEAQEAMAPRLLFLEGPARAGKTRAAAAVLDLPEARRMWLLRTRGAHAVDEAIRRDPRGGGGAAILSSGSFALASFQRLFHQLLGFSPEATSRERKAAVVALLEGCGEERERLGRYAKPILEILGIERADEGGADDEEVLGSDRGSSRLSNGSTGKMRLESRASSAAVSSGKAHGVTSKSRSTRGGVSRRGGLSLEPESPAADGDAEGSGSGSGSQPPADGAVAAKRKPSRQASRLGLARDRSEASQIGEPLPGERASRERGEREGLGGFLDAVSAAAMEDATRHLCSGAMDALLGDGVDIEHDGCEGPDRREARDGDDGGDGYDGGDDDDHRHPHHHHHDSEQHDSSAEAKMARAVIMGRLSGAVAFTRQRNGVQRRDHNKRFRAVLQRRKNTLESILVSTHGAARLCKTMALMLERLLLGRATQAAPAQPSLPGWILLVEDAQWLDPYSMGLIRALLERCSIPLVVVMTHVSGRGAHDASSGVPETRVTRPDATNVDARSVGRADESMHDVDESAHGGVRLYSSGDVSSSAGDTISAEASSRSGAAGGVGSGLDRVDVWGAGLGLSTTRVEAMDTKRWLRTRPGLDAGVVFNDGGGRRAAQPLGPPRVRRGVRVARVAGRKHRAVRE
jgi:cAMP-specific phosphodiesterase 4